MLVLIALMHPLVKKETDDPEVKVETTPVVTVDGMTSNASLPFKLAIKLIKNYFLLLVKQEKDEVKPVVATKSYQRRINPSEVSAKEIFESDGEILFFQVRHYFSYPKYCVLSS